MTLSTVRNVAFFFALFATGISLGGALAHLLELPNKFGLPREQYFIVQQIYAGWWQLAYALAVQLIAIFALVILYLHETRTFLTIFVALLCLISAQVLFWVYTYPANVATNNWTSQPENWETLRRQWEYSHAGGAIFQLLVFCALLIAVLRRGV